MGSCPADTVAGTAKHAGPLQTADVLGLDSKSAEANIHLCISALRLFSRLSLSPNPGADRQPCSWSVTPCSCLDPAVSMRQGCSHNHAQLWSRHAAVLTGSPLGWQRKSSRKLAYTHSLHKLKRAIVAPGGIDRATVELCSLALT